MKTLLKVSALVLATGFGQNVNAAVVPTIIPLAQFDLQDSERFKNTIFGSYTQFQDIFTFNFSGTSNIAGKLTATFNDVSQNFTNFNAIIYRADDTNLSNPVANFSALLTGKKLSGGFPTVSNLTSLVGYKMIVNGTTGNFVKSAYGGTLTVSPGVDNIVTDAPEPEEWAMMMLGLPLMGFVARRRRAV